MALGQVSVFCGSRPGNDPAFAAAATGLGTLLAERGIGLVYGGRATGVITESLADHEIAHAGLTRLDVVGTMHERKARMAELSDAVIMAPGGFGTYEEFMEAVTWVHLGIHEKPCGVLNVDGFFDHLLRFLAHAVRAGFIPPSLVDNLIVADEPGVLLDTLSQAARGPTRDE
jgi:uncharacterized protein (TIGR00730 family)